LWPLFRRVIYEENCGRRRDWIVEGRLTFRERIWMRVDLVTAFVLALIVAGTAHAQETSGQPQPAYKIAFRTLAPGDTDIFLADRAGRDARPLVTHPSLDYNASFSQDGRWIVFTSDRTGTADLYRIRPDGSQLERLTDHPAFDDQGAISPDGRSVAFVSTRDGQADVWVLDLATRKVRNLTNHAAGDFRPSWSPDGKWLAFSSDRDPPATSCPNTTAPGPGPFVTPQYTAVYVVRTDGSELRRVSPGGAVAASPKWSKDGSQLAFHSIAEDEVCSGSLMLGRGPSQLVITELKSGKQSAVTSGQGLKLFPHWIAKNDLAYVDANGVRFTGKGAAGADGQFGRPDWSPEGRTMVFHREVDPRPDRDREFTFSSSRDPGFSLLSVPGHAAFSPDGERLVYLSLNFQGASRNGVLIRANLDGSDRRTLYEGAISDDLSGPAWSPSGDRILFGAGGFFQRAQIRTARLMSIRPDGTGLVPLTTGEANDAMPSWSPDGKQVVFRAASGTARALYILDVASGARRKLDTGSDYDTFPSWSPKGDWISFTSKRDGNYEIYRIRPDGSALQRLTNSPGVDAHPSFSPDGEWIAFATGMQGFKDESVALLPGVLPPPFQPYGEIAVMRSDGSDLRLLTDNSVEEGTPTWVPNRFASRR